MKTEMTSFDIAAIVYELNHIINNARVENIYQLNNSTLFFRLHRPNQPTMQLLIEAGRRIHLTSYLFEKPFTPPSFCMTLRKHLKNGKITDIRQYEFERTIVLQIKVGESIFQLIVELFGEGNVILVNSDGVITAALTYKKMRDRNILRNEAFRHAPSSGRDPLQVDRSEFEALKSYGQMDVVRALTRLVSIGGLYAEEILLRANIDKNTPCQTLESEQLENIFTQLRNLLSRLSEGKLEPTLVVDQNGDWLDVTPFPLKRYTEFKNEIAASFNQALDEYYSKATRLKEIVKAREQYEKELATQKRMMEEQKKTIEDSKKTLERERRIGDLIYKHLGELQLLIQEINDEKQKGKNWEHTTSQLEQKKQEQRIPAIYFDSLDPRHQILNVSIEGNAIPMQINRSAQANAAEYYRRMKKAEKKLEGSIKALQETETRIKNLEQSLTKKMDQAERKTPQKREEKAWYEKFRWFESSDGFLVVAGKDATTNEILIKKYLESHDIVFHADIIGAPFVAIKTYGKPLSEQVINEAAQFAASYSRAWREMLAAIDVYWILPNQITKTPPSGQFLEKGSFAIQGTKNYVRKVPLRVGIGISVRNGQPSVIWGPASTVSKLTSTFVEIAPGQQPANLLIRHIRRELVDKAPKSLREAILSIPTQQLQASVPFGKGELTHK